MIGWKIQTRVWSCGWVVKCRKTTKIHNKRQKHTQKKQQQQQSNNNEVTTMKQRQQQQYKH